MAAAYEANDEKARLVVSSCRRFNERLIQPKRLGFNKIDAVFALVGRTLPSIELELHRVVLGDKLYRFNIFLPHNAQIRSGRAPKDDGMRAGRSRASP